MGRRYEDRVRRDPVHIDTGSGLNIIHMNVAVFGDQVDDVILRGHLHGDREIVLGLRGEEYVDSFLEERLVACWSLADLCVRERVVILGQ